MTTKLGAHGPEQFHAGTSTLHAAIMLLYHIMVINNSHNSHYNIIAISHSSYIMNNAGTYIDNDRVTVRRPKLWCRNLGHAFAKQMPPHVVYNVHLYMCTSATALLDRMTLAPYHPWRPLVNVTFANALKRAVLKSCALPGDPVVAGFGFTAGVC